MGEPLALMMGARECAELIVRPDANANKYSRGTVAVIGGSGAYPGAPILSALAAARSGAGYVRLITPESAAVCARNHLLSIPVSACAEGADQTLCAASVPQVQEALAKTKVAVIGPGLGTSNDAEEFLAALTFDRPVVLDADALTIIARNPEVLAGFDASVRVLTPHEGEAARLLGRSVTSRARDALELARMYRSIVLLKGPDTLIATPDGGLRAVGEGGPELAKAGSGDVLAGIIAAFMCQGMHAFDAVSLAAFVHGRAGKRMAQGLSIHSVMPEDIISAIGPALLDLEETCFS